MSKKHKKNKKVDKTFRRTLKAITPSGNVKKKDRPLEKLEGKNLRVYAICAMFAAALVGPATVLARAHVDYLGGHRDKSIIEQVKCVINNPPPLWGSGFVPNCPIREADFK